MNTTTNIIDFIENTGGLVNELGFFPRNFINDADSYKAMQFAHLPAKAQFAHSSIVPRKEWNEQPFVVVAGMQILAAYLASVRITREMVEDAERRAWNRGSEFNMDWYIIVHELDGKLPLKMEAVPDGTVLPVGMPICTFENTDERFPWLPSFIETNSQDWIQKSTTVATKCRWALMLLKDFCRRTGTPEEHAYYMLHNFGERSGGGFEGRALTGIAHGLLFNGSDAMSANAGISKFYGYEGEFFKDVDATEHSTMCANSDAEKRCDKGAFLMTLDRLAAAVRRARKNPNALPIVSAVIDTYDDERFATEFIPGAYQQICKIGGKYVARPDTGNPVTKPAMVFSWLKSGLTKQGYGDVMQTTGTGHELLPDNLGILQGDGLNWDSLPEIIDYAIQNNLAAGNFIYGMGEGLTNGTKRADLSFSQKGVGLFMRQVNRWVDLFKDPKGDSGKRSYKGRHGTFYNTRTGEYFADRLDVVDGFKRDPAVVSALVPAMCNGSWLLKDSWETCQNRARANTSDWVNPRYAEAA